MPPSKITLPPPEQLGVQKPQLHGTNGDWGNARRRLDALGAVTFQITKLREGGCRFCCLLPTDQANYNHRIEADAATEAEAIRLGLERAESWSSQR